MMSRGGKGLDRGSTKPEIRLMAAVKVDGELAPVSSTCPEGITLNNREQRSHKKRETLSDICKTNAHRHDVKYKVSMDIHGGFIQFKDGCNYGKPRHCLTVQSVPLRGRGSKHRGQCCRCHALRV